MKKILSAILSVGLILSLCACARDRKVETPFDPSADAKSLLESGCFSEELTEIPAEIACSTYGIDPATVTASACYGSTGATAEELAILVLKDADSTQAALTALGYRVEDRTASMKSYLPTEVSKLEKAVTAVRGNSVLLVVANDYDPVHSFLEL